MSDTAPSSMIAQAEAAGTEVKRAVEQATQLAAAPGRLAKLVFGIIILLAGAFASTSLPVTRHRFGLLAITVQGPIGIAIALVWLAVLWGTPGGWLVLAWTVALTVHWCGELGWALRRLCRPSPGGHVHRWQNGEYRAAVRRLLAFAIRYVPARLRARPGALAIGLEATLLFTLSWLISAFTPVLAALDGPTGLVGASMLPSFGAIGVVLQEFAAYLRSQWSVTLVLDQQIEQRGLAQAVASQSEQTTAREPDGVVHLDRPSPLFAG